MVFAQRTNQTLAVAIIQIHHPNLHMVTVGYGYAVHTFMHGDAHLTVIERLQGLSRGQRLRAVFKVYGQTFPAGRADDLLDCFVPGVGDFEDFSTRRAFDA